MPELERLKVVTVVFCDVANSTALTAQLANLDWIALSRRYFEIIRRAVSQHGGTCGRLAGDGVMAVFGVPALNDDDTLRAVRAAVQIRTRVGELNAETVGRHGIPLEVRIGIHSGLALVRNAGSVEERIAGLTPIIAKRLEAVADGGILISDATYMLVRDAVVAEQVHPPLRLKGIPEPVPAWRVISLSADQRGPHPAGPFIGRQSDLVLLQRLLDRVVEHRAGHLVTILGAPGIGKSRVVREFEWQVREQASVFWGTCLPYGEGVTFWPIAQIIREAAGAGPDDSPKDVLDRLSDSIEGQPHKQRILDRIGQLLGWIEEPTARSRPHYETLGRLLGRVFEARARRRPLVLVFNDLQWAEPGLLDTVHELAVATSTAPIMLVCLARPELLDERPSWAGGLIGATTVSLMPLSFQDSARLVTHLLDGRELAHEDELLLFVERHAEGNPLFIEAYLAMLGERQILRLGETGRWELTAPLESVAQKVPPRLRLVIQARLERLEPQQRLIVERAAVVGVRFHPADLVGLSPDLDPIRIPTILDDLERLNLIVPERGATAQFATPEYGRRTSYRFQHLLYHDVAYDSLSTAERAQQHERYASWLAEHSKASQTQADELIAHHLYQAYLNRCDADPGAKAPDVRELAQQAGERLLAAGRRAGDLATAFVLLERALDLLPDDHPQRLTATLNLAVVLRETDAARAASVYQQAAELAAATGADGAAMHAQLGTLDLVGFYTDPERSLEEGEELAARAIEVFERLEDHLGLATALRVRAWVQFAVGRCTAAQTALQQAREHAMLARDERMEASILDLRSIVLFWGPSPLTVVAQELEQTQSWAKGNGLRGLEATILGLQARVAAMRGDFGEARRLNREAGSIREYTGERLTAAAAGSISEGLVELLADEPAQAAQVLRKGFVALQQMGGRAPQVNVGTLLARALLRQGIEDEAEELTRIVERAVPISQLDARMKWRSIRAVILARRGEHAEADRLIKQSLDLATHSEQPVSKAEVLVDSAEVLWALGQREAAHRNAGLARKLLEEKGNLVAARQAQQLSTTFG